MKAVLTAAVLMCLISGCTSQRQGTRTVTETWNNRVVVDNAVVETIKAIKGTPTGNTGRGFQVKKQSSWTESNMPQQWR